MTAFLVDESCPRAITDALRTAGHDVCYAAETNRRSEDAELVGLAQAENRIIISEDFDFGELLIRHRLRAPGAIILFMPQTQPEARAQRVMDVVQSPALILEGRLTIVSVRQIRQRPLD